jgi:hypothetical protein
MAITTAVAAGEPPEWPYTATTNTNTTHATSHVTYLNARTDQPSTQSVQAAVEGAVELDDDGCLEFLGKRFRLAQRVGLMPMLAFANAARKGVDSDDMEGLATMYVLIRDCLDQTRPVETDEDGQPVLEADGNPKYAGPSEWQRFEAHCFDQQADGDELMEFITKAMGVLAARPRKRREISSGSSPRTLPKSKGNSSSPDIRRWPGAEELTPVADLAR